MHNDRFIDLFNHIYHFLKDAFLLLIFFLVTTTIDVDRGIGLTLPAKGEETEVRSKNIANLLINAQGEVFIDDEVIGVHEIARVVREKLIQNPQLRQSGMHKPGLVSLSLRHRPSMGSC